MSKNHTRIQSRFCTLFFIPRSSAERGVSPRSRSAAKGHRSRVPPAAPAPTGTRYMRRGHSRYRYKSGWRLCTTPSPLFSLTCIHKFPILQQHLLADGISSLSGLHRVFVLTRFLFSSCRPWFFFSLPLSHVLTLCCSSSQARNACRRLQCHRRLQFPRYLAAEAPFCVCNCSLASQALPLDRGLSSLP